MSLIVASQYPDDLNDELRLCFASKVCHGHGDDVEGVRKLKTALNWQDDMQVLASLEKFQSVVQNRHYGNSVSRNLGWPHYLLYRHLKDRGSISVSNVSQVEGYNSGQLSVDELLKHMREMELIEIINDEVHLR